MPGIGAEQSQRHDRQSVTAPVGVLAGRQHDAIGQLVPPLLLEPIEVTHVLVLDEFAQLHLKGDDVSAIPLDDEVYLPSGVSGAQVPHACGRCLSEHPDTLGGQRLKECAEPRASASPHPGAFADEQIRPPDAHQPGRQRRVPQVMLGRPRQPFQRVEDRNPRRDRVKDEDPREVLAVALDRRSGQLVDFASQLSQRPGWWSMRRPWPSPRHSSRRTG